MAMFDIKKSKKIKLSNNTTKGDKIAKIGYADEIEGDNNLALCETVPKEENTYISYIKSIALKIIPGFVIAALKKIFLQS